MWFFVWTNFIVGEKKLLLRDFIQVLKFIFAFVCFILRKEVLFVQIVNLKFQNLLVKKIVISSDERKRLEPYVLRQCWPCQNTTHVTAFCSHYTNVNCFVKKSFVRSTTIIHATCWCCMTFWWIRLITCGYKISVIECPILCVNVKNLMPLLC